MQTFLPHSGVQCRHFCPTLGRAIDVFVPHWVECALFAPRWGVLLMCLPHAGVRWKHVRAQRRSVLLTYLPHAGCTTDACPTLGCIGDGPSARRGVLLKCLFDGGVGV